MGNQYSSLILITMMVVAFYLLILRPQKKRQQAQQQTLMSLTPGTRVLLGSGLYGTIVAMGEKQALVELAPGVEVTVLKPAIVRAVTEGEEDTEWLYDDDDVDEISGVAGDDVARDDVAGDDVAIGRSDDLNSGKPSSTRE